jgi:hypothetical protein
MSRWLMGLLTVAWASLLVGCERGSTPALPRAISAWQPAPLGSHSLLGEVGADCSAAGPPSCRTELCLHVSEFHDRGYFCSTICRKPENCPAGWPCGPLIAGMTERVCVPPADWDGGRAVVPDLLTLPSSPPPPLIQSLIDGGAP